MVAKGSRTTGAGGVDVVGADVGGVVGAGMVGESLGKALIKAGYGVVFSSRDPQSDKMQALVADTGATVGSIEHTIAANDVIAVALHWDAVAEVVQLSGWHGKSSLI